LEHKIHQNGEGEGTREENSNPTQTKNIDTDVLMNDCFISKDQLDLVLREKRLNTAEESLSTPQISTIGKY
jgi:hypothetical protein